MTWLVAAPAAGPGALGWVRSAEPARVRPGLGPVPWAGSGRADGPARTSLGLVFVAALDWRLVRNLRFREG